MSNKAHPKILVIDDDEDQRMLLREALCAHYGELGNQLLDLSGA